ncbi:penicillin-binding protein activator [Collimonas pratensis]|uniref:LppC lipofamily protein n=1 Tax=Collimonas pratensis TaxID=279113 RepID=A0A127R5L3_9BURK|nr:penicillin-binding protein activator [Collimonas pratensis]AMP07473.1 lppC lipofamily protein [Collimonas pratensis]AMP17242.1 lppC lipofamily protein [Collimonas pratensis]
MLYKWAKLAKRVKLALAAGILLNGLCPPALANTTLVDVTAADADGNVIPLASIALLLPLRSGPLGAAADAVRSGFLNAYERDKSGLAVSVIEAADTAPDMLAAYTDAAKKYDILVGPLSRTGLSAILQNGHVDKPTIALTQPDSGGALPAQLLPVGLSIEAEARQVATWVGADYAPGKVLVLSTSAAWQKRVANAFVQQIQGSGLHAEVVTLNLENGAFNVDALTQLQQKVEGEMPRLLFAALNADQTKQIRIAIGDQTPIFGISQLNPLTLDDNNPEHQIPALNGVRLVDIPWQVQPDHPAVMVYPRQEVAADQRRNADLERLYALGIDAFRIAREVAARNSVFQIDGVTGKLNVRFGVGAPSFERIEPTAIYQNGIVMPLQAQ